MARRKVSLSYINNAVKRRATYKKRKIGLLKKLYEITVLCAVEACAIIYTPDKPNPEVWPSEEQFQSVISRSREVSEQRKRLSCQESLVGKNIVSSQEKLNKLRNENRIREIDLYISQYLAGQSNLENANIIDLNDIAFLADKYLLEIGQRIEMLKLKEVRQPATANGEAETMTQELETNVDVMTNLRNLSVA